MSEIQKTTDYAIFKKHPNNREEDPGNIKKITQSIKARNLLSFRPILVDSEMRVIDGQHRLTVAKLLGLEIYYQVQSECTHEDIVLLNQHQKGWSIEDFIDYYVSLGNKNYLSFKTLSQLTGCSYNALVRMMGYQKSSYVNIKNGTFKYFDLKEVLAIQSSLEKAKEAIAVLSAIIIKDSSFIRTERFKAALCSFVKNEQIDFSTFLSKIRIKSDAIKPCTSLPAYMEMFLNIYNWRNQTPAIIETNHSY